MTPVQNIEDVYELSPTQQGLLFHVLDAPEAGQFFMQSGRLIKSPDKDAFLRAWHRVAERHPVLRTSFHWEELDKPVQVVHRSVTIPFSEEDWRGLQPQEQQRRLREYRKENRKRGFDLKKAPLLRIAFFRLSDEDYYFIWSRHHILLDGWSGPLLSREMLSFYQAFRQGRDVDLPLPRPYRDYIAWLQRQDVAKAELFWRNYLKGFTTPTPIPLDRQGTAEAGTSGHSETQRLDLSVELSAQLRDLSRGGRFSLSVLVQAGYALLLARYAAQTDVVIGTAFSGRPPDLPGAESIIGLFVNALPVRFRFNPEQEVLDWLVELQALQAEVTQFDYTPLAQVQRWSEVGGGTRLCNVSYVFENFPHDPADGKDRSLGLETTQKQGSRRAKPRGGAPTENGAVSFSELTESHSPLTLYVHVAPQDERLSLSLVHSADRLHGDDAGRMLEQLQAILTSFVENPTQPIAQVSLLPPGERERIVRDWNATEAEYPVDACIHQIFEAIALRTPQARAVVFGDQQLDYRTLNEKANQLAHRLQQFGVGPEVRVGLCLERSLEAIVGLVGIFKAGGVYVPLDPAYPLDRLGFMLEDAGVQVLITREPLLAHLPPLPPTVRRLDCQDPVLATEATANGNAGVTPSNLAYVIYTSGSTGKPKGVMLEHRGLVNLIHAQLRMYNVAPTSRVLQFASLSFDASVAEIWRALAGGACLYMTQAQSLLPGPELVQLLADQQITHATLPPSVLSLLPDTPLPSFHTVVVGGDTCPAELVSRWAPGRQFFNGYGPTEATVCTTVARCLPEEGKPSIGKPIANMQAYVLDRNFKLMPVGAPGELYLGGDGLARGYGNRPALTAERFVPHPFSRVPGARLYKTGDQARWLADGNLEFLGRIDYQVKVRGFRIELGEIEAGLRQHPAVVDATVLAREDTPGEKKLVAYVVAKADPHELAEKLLADWQVHFDAIPLLTESTNPLRYFPGWNNSFTNQPIDQVEMEEWAENTTERILRLKPRTVLDIGCGSGAILFRVAPSCERYVGIDFSEAALDYVKHHRQNYLSNDVKLELLHQRADELVGLEPESFDCVILNSVAPYFPTIEYCLEVLEKALRLVRPGGALFIGDVRHRKLLEGLHTAIQISQAPTTLTSTQLFQRTRSQVALERELTIDPLFFNLFAQNQTRVRNVEILLKRGRSQNELTRFRYDVVLHVESASAPEVECPWLDWAEPLNSLEALRILLEEGEPTALGLRQIPNHRIAADLAATELARQEGQIVGQIRQAANAQASGLAPEDFVDLGRELGYETELSWASGDETGRFDVAYWRPKTPRPNFPTLAGLALPWSDYANVPSAVAIHSHLIPELRSHLGERLPDYMVPALFVFLPSLPLTPSGKVDRRSLPAPQGRPQLQEDFVAASDATQDALAAVWAKVLKLDRVGVHDNFFELGGDSILSIQIVARAKEAGLALTTKNLFEHPTIASLARVARRADSIVQADQGLVTGPVPLTPIQHRFFEWNLPEPHRFMMTRQVPLTFQPQLELLQRSVEQLLLHHDALRLRFRQHADGSWQQVIAGAEAAQPSVAHVDLSALSPREQSAAVAAQTAQMQAQLDLQRGPLFQAAWIERGPDRPGVLLLLAHHLVIDVVSWRMVQEDLLAVYQQLEQQQTVQLPPKTTSLKRWAEQLRDYAQSPGLAAERAYWLSPARAAVPSLPVDHPQGSNSSDAVAQAQVTLDEARTQAMLRELPTVQGIQVNDLLLTALALAVERWSGHDRLLVHLEGHGRETLLPGVDLSRTVGWFTALTPVLLEVQGRGRTALRAVQEQLRAIPQGGIGYGVLRYLSPDQQLVQQLQELPAAQILFNYMGKDGAVSQRKGRTPKAESSGSQPKAPRRHLLEINGSVSTGQLELRLAYCLNVHEPETIERLAAYLTEALEQLIDQCRTTQITSVPAQNIEDLYELSLTQQGILFHVLDAPESGQFFMQSGRMIANLERDAFVRAWQRVIDRHSVLRTSFHWEKLEQPLQVVHRQAPVPVQEEDLRGLDAAEQQQRLRDYRRSDRRRGFNLSEAPLLRLAFFQLTDSDYYFIWSRHHILLDGWSGPLLSREMLSLYQAYRQGRDLALPEPQPYRNYIDWLKRQDLGQAEHFWRKYLQGFTTPTPIPLDRRAGALTHAGSETQRLDLSVELSAALKELARSAQLTLSILVQAGWAVLLGRYTGQDDVVMGTAFSGRPPELPGAETMIGLFINALPVRFPLRPQQSVVDWLVELRTRQAELTQFDYTPLAQVQRWSEVPAGTRLCQVSYVFENFPHEPSDSQRPTGGAKGGQRTKGRARPDAVATPFSELAESHSALTLYAQVTPQEDRLALSLVHASERLHRDDAVRMLEQLQVILTRFTQDPQQSLSTVQLLSDEQRQRIVQEWNATTGDIPQGCMSAIFEEHVARAPAALAIDALGTQMSYSELNARANRLAWQLGHLGVRPEVRVGLYLERSVDALVGLLAIFKAGGVYVPLDPAYPQERLAFLIADAGLEVLITRAGLKAQLPALPSSVQVVDCQDPQLAAQPSENLPQVLDPSHLAYLIYTSGSTGQPKGVLLEQRGLVNLIEAQKQLYEVQPTSRILQFASLSFDASVAEIWRAFGSGACLCLAASDTLLPGSDLVHWLAEQRITHVTLPPSVLALLPAAELPELRTVVVGGDNCPAELVARWAPGRRFFNGYGPTEATVCATVARCLPDEGLPSIGRALPNVQAYVLDERYQLLPVGVPGELYLGGVGLARGYHQRPALTAERFIPNPFSAVPGARLYRTGDQVRWNADGTLEFLGRIDQQVKVRGFRIELGEIENAIHAIPGVQQAAVSVQEENGDKRLVAYLVMKENTELPVSEYRSILLGKLPDYMIPSAWMMLSALPLTPNGKVDRKALPKPAGSVTSESTYIAPRNPTESAIAEIWAKLLKVERVSIQDNFFLLGGHSLLVTQAVSHLREALQVELPLRTLFEAPTVAGLAERVEVLRRDQQNALAPPLVPVNRDQPLPLSFAQQRLWFIDQLSPGLSLYNVSGRFRIRGELNREALTNALTHLWQRHEVLRARFPAVNGEPVQVIDPLTNLDLPISDLRDLNPEERQKEVRRLFAQISRSPFDLERGPLTRLQLVLLRDDESLLLHTLHHTITDGWSMDIYTRELTALYQAFCAGDESPLPALPVQYADFAVWQRNWLAGEVLERQLGYWRTQLRGLATLELPTDKPRPAIQTFGGAYHTFALPDELTIQLRNLSQVEGTTLFMTLLAAFQMLLGRYSGQEDVVVGSPIAGRNRRELEGLIGFFVNTLVLRTDLAGDPTFIDLLKRVREVCLGAYAHQDLPFEKLVEELKPRRDASRNPLFQVVFGLQSMPQSAREANPKAGRRPAPDQKGPANREGLSGNGTSKFDLGLQCFESAQGIRCIVGYNTDLFEIHTVARLAVHYQGLLQSIVANPRQSLSTFALADGSDPAMAVGSETSEPQQLTRNSELDALTAQIDQLSDEELTALLEQTLAERENG